MSYSNEQIVEYLEAVEKAADTWVKELEYEPEMLKAYYWKLFSEVFKRQTKGKPIVKSKVYIAVGMNESTCNTAVKKAHEEGYFLTEPMKSTEVLKLTKKGEDVLKKACSDALEEMDRLYNVNEN